MSCFGVVVRLLDVSSRENNSFQGIDTAKLCSVDTSSSSVFVEVLIPP